MAVDLQFLFIKDSIYGFLLRVRANSLKIVKFWLHIGLA